MPATARLVSLITGQEYPLRGSRLLAGRSQQADLRLTDSGVSRQHAEFVHDGATWWLADLGSTNGSHVNGTQVSRAELHDGDRVELGPVALVFHDGPAL
jgi:pSer/pThr/pTyr-binding forkhead associated (FHA) protein